MEAPHVRVPRRFRRAKLKHFTEDHFEDPEDFEALKDYYNDREWEEGKSFYLHGPSNVGKTHLAAAMTRSLALLHWKERLRWDYEFVSATDMFTHLVSSFDVTQDEERRQPWFKTYRTVQFLVIDGLGLEDRSGPMKERIQNRLAQILTARHDNALSTLITSQQGAEYLASIYGDAVLNVMKRTFTFVAVSGK